MSLIAELKRRNVIRVAIAYAVIAWVLAQVADLAFDNFGTPDWVAKTVLFLLALGFPLAVFFAWAFELTPEGVKKQAEVDRSTSITQNTGRKLNYLITAVLAVAVGMLLFDKFALRDAPVPGAATSVAASTTEKSLAVLPFVAMSNGPDDEYFADGLTEEILNSLAQLPELLVTARTSAFSFKGQDVPIPEIATALGVAHVVEGSVRRAGDRLRITAQLIRAHDGFHLWSETYERSNADSFGVQGEIAARIASALDVILDDAQLERMRNSGMRNPEAFIAYQKAVELNANAHDESGQARLDGLEEANVFYDRVLELEPNTPAAYFDRADYYIHFAVEADERESRPEDMPAAIESAKRDLQNAIRNSRTEGDRLTATLEYALIAEEWRRLPELFRSAVQSTDCFVPSWWAGLGGFFEPLDGTLTLWQRAQTCDPLSYYNWGNIVLIQTTLGAYDDALATATRAMQVVPHRLTAEKLIMAHVGLGDFDAAEAANERLIEDPALRTMHRLRIAAAKGDVETAQKLNDALAGRPNGYSATLSTLAMLGERDLANALAAELDARALGYVRLLDESGSCLCGAPFDLEFTPNFARLIEEAELQWPPRSPIEWPLKDW